MINRNHKQEIVERIQGIVYPAMRRAETHLENVRDDTITKLTNVVEEIERAYGNCQACYGKGYSTVRKGTIGYPDFPGDRGFKNPSTTKVKFCNCGRGEALKNLWGKVEVL